MEVDIDKQDIDIQKSINQIVDIINLIDDKGKIPENVKAFFVTHYNNSVEYNKIEAKLSLKEQIMEEYTAEILTYISNKYLKRLT